jgi:putative flippase GtrA
MLQLAAARPYVRYVMASGISLAWDMGAFLLFLHLGMGGMAASALGYALGIIVHWTLSTRFVFVEGMVSSGTERARQKGMFVGTALLGLAITTAIVGLGSRMGLDPRLAKLGAIAVSFQATYLARIATVFRR